ncbi:hypothetical protein ACOME3_010683 [Neoechinorhynchus agilis]
MTKSESQCVEFSGPGTMDKITTKGEKIPELNDEMVRVNLKYAGVNFIDILKKLGIYDRSTGITAYPFVPGCEASGVIEAVGAKVNSMNVSGTEGPKFDFKVGDRVTILKPDGLYRDLIDTDPQSLVKIPDGMSLEHASCLALNYLTAYDMMFKMCRLKEGDVILMPQAAGGVGMAVIQMSKTVPNTKIIGMCSGSKHQLLKEMGVDHLIDYRTQDYVVEVRKLYPKGVDVIFDALNGPESGKFFDLLKPFGRVVYYGVASASGDGNSMFKKAKLWLSCFSTSSLKILTTNKSIAGYHLGHLGMVDQNEINDSWKHIFKLYEQGVLKMDLCYRASA